MVGHAIALRATFERVVDELDEAIAALEAFPGSWSTRCRRRCTTRAATRSPSGVSGATSRDPHSLNLFVVGDNLLKGAALNAVQIAELLVERGLLGRPVAATA